MIYTHPAHQGELRVKRRLLSPVHGRLQRLWTNAAHFKCRASVLNVAFDAVNSTGCYLGMIPGLWALCMTMDETIEFKSAPHVHYRSHFSPLRARAQVNAHRRGQVTGTYPSWCLVKPDYMSVLEK